VSMGLDKLRKREGEEEITGHMVTLAKYFIVCR